jgi:uncharacterized protein (DUF1810 family)
MNTADAAEVTLTTISETAVQVSDVTVEVEKRVTEVVDTVVDKVPDAIISAEDKKKLMEVLALLKDVTDALKEFKDLTNSLKPSAVVTQVEEVAGAAASCWSCISKKK